LALRPPAAPPACYRPQGHNSITQAIAENELLQMMSHPYVVSLHYSFQDAVNLYMVLDYAGGGDLFALIDKK
jgi:serine/threonine protein kinase